MQKLRFNKKLNALKTLRRVLGAEDVFLLRRCRAHSLCIQAVVLIHLPARSTLGSRHPPHGPAHSTRGTCLMTGHAPRQGVSPQTNASYNYQSHCNMET
jgi:hypothetical protein